MSYGHAFKGYRIRSARNPSWDYAGPGRYFVTVCTRGRVPWFGTVRDDEMYLSDIGRIVDDEWKQTGQKRGYITLDAYVIMPDHFHAIIIIHDDDIGLRNTTTRNPCHRSQWQSGSLGAVIQQFKRACSHHIHEAGHPNFAWLPRFHDRIIRDNAEFERIRQYIIDNPHHWKK